MDNLFSYSRTRDNHIIAAIDVDGFELSDTKEKEKTISLANSLNMELLAADNVVTLYDATPINHSNHDTPTSDS